LGWSAVTLDLSVASGEINVEWMRASDGAIKRSHAIADGGKRTLQAPFTGDAVLYLSSK